jgi:hypothetical protein
MATWSWRVDRHLASLGEGSDARALKSRMRQLATLWGDHDVKIYDYTGKAYDPEEIWDDVIGSDGVKQRPIITGMREPRITVRGVMIQRGIPIIEDSAEGSA